MSETYTRINWKDGENGGTPISADNLNLMDLGIEKAHQLIEELNENGVGGVTEEQLKNAVDAYFIKNPIQTVSDIFMRVSDGYIQFSTDNLTWKNVIAVSELKGQTGKTAYEYAKDGGYTGTEEEFAKKLAQENPTREEFSQLSDTVNDKANQTEMNEVKDQLKDISASETTGISAELTTAFRRYFTNVQTLLTQLVYVTESNLGNTVIQNASDIVTVLDGGTVTPDEPDTPDNPEITLSSISVTYTGGEVAVGTALTSLTGVAVKATYSDGSTKNVTGYTLSGTIAEGNNTITVSYEGKTTTFTVTGVEESSGEDNSEYETVNIADVAEIQEGKKYNGNDIITASVYNLYVVEDVKEGDTFVVAGHWNNGNNGLMYGFDTDGTSYDVGTEITDWSNKNYSYGTGTWKATRDYYKVYIQPQTGFIDKALNAGEVFTWTRKKVE